MINDIPENPKPGYYRGIHHSDYTEALKALLLANSHTMAKQLLEPLLDTIEAENQIEQLGIDAWHYEQLATIYHAEGDDAAELAVLERCMQQSCSGYARVAERIAGVRNLLGADE